MNNNEFYKNLRFETRSRPAPRHLIAVGSAIGVFILLWFTIPQNALFWVLLPLVGLLVWVASYGWRRALATLHELVHRLEQQ